MNRRDFMKGVAVCAGALLTRSVPGNRNQKQKAQIEFPELVENQLLGGNKEVSLQPYDSVNGLDYHTEINRIVLVNGYGEVAYSDNWGETWLLVNRVPHNAKSQCIAILDRDWWAVGFDDGTLWHTKDGGVTWYEKEYIYCTTGDVTWI